MSCLTFDQFDFYIIHVKKHTERYDHLKTEFKKINIDINNNDRVHFVEGVIPNERHKYRRRGFYGTSLGHYTVIQASLASNNPYSFIIEDDVIFLDNFIDNVNLTFSNLYKNQESYDIVQFRTPTRRCRPPHCIIKDNYISGHCKFVTTECVYLTKEIKHKILSNDKDWFFNGEPIDVWYSHNLRCIKTINNYTWQCDLGSIARSNR